MCEIYSTCVLCRINSSEKLAQSEGFLRMNPNIFKAHTQIPDTKGEMGKQENEDRKYTDGGGDGNYFVAGNDEEITEKKGRDKNKKENGTKRNTFVCNSIAW